MSFSGSGFSRFLKLFTKDKYVHCTIATDKKLNNAYSFGRKYPCFPLPSGFVKENIIKNCNYFKNTISKIYELEIEDDKYYNLINDINNYLDNIDKYKYNIIGLYDLWKNNIKHRKYHFVCTQFCAKVLIDNNIIDFNKDYSLIKPKDFLNLELAKEIYEGKTIEYLKRIPTN